MKLQWFVGSNGNWFADARSARYGIELLPETITMTPAGLRSFRFRVTINGLEFGGAVTLEGAKHVAQLHEGIDERQD